MSAINFKCKKCGSIKYEIKEKSNGTGVAKGLYCAECGFWHKWLGKKDVVVGDNVSRTAAANTQLANENEKEIVTRTAQEIVDMIGNECKLPNTTAYERLVLRAVAERIEAKYGLRGKE